MASFSRLLVRRDFPGKALLNSLLHLPLVLPPVVVGYLLLIAMGRRGFIGSWLYDWFGLSFAFSWRGAVLAAAVMSFPLMVRAIHLALEGVDIKRAGGAYPRRRPLAGVFHDYATVDATRHYRRHRAGFRPLAGRVWRHHHVCCQYSRETRTIPSAMYTLIQTPGGEGAAARLCLISIALALVSLLISEWLARLSRQRMGK